MPVGDIRKESDGKALVVQLTSTVLMNRLVVVEGWVGWSIESGDSGGYITIDVSRQEVQLLVPSGLTVAKGDVIYITVATLTGHYPQDAAFTTAAGSGKIPFMKATAAKDANNVVTGIMLVPQGGLS